MTPVRSLRAGDFFAPKGVRVMAKTTYQAENEIREVVEKFERCQYAVEEFTHARHLTVACWYLCTMSHEKALGRMRVSLTRFIAHHGMRGYHETITRFWMELLGDFLRQQAPAASLRNKTNDALECYANKDVLFSYYTRDRVMSEVAKREWMEPDLRTVRAGGPPAIRDARVRRGKPRLRPVQG
jgi:hypothetical protein